MEKKEKVSTQDILQIKAGETRSFMLPTGKARATAITLAYQQSLRNPRPDVEKYMCHSQKPTSDGFGLEITAIRK